MKKIVSVLLLCSMIMASSFAVFAVESNTEYDLNELFVNYKETAFSDMVKFIGDYSQISTFVDWMRATNGQENFMFFVHLDKYQPLASNYENMGLVAESTTGKYVISSARITKPSSTTMSFCTLLGEAGNRVATVEIKADFVNYICSLDRIEGNKIILDFLINLLSSEGVSGISWYKDYNIYN